MTTKQILQDIANAMRHVRQCSRLVGCQPRRNAGERKTLNELGISQINLTAKKESGVVRNGNKPSRAAASSNTAVTPGGLGQKGYPQAWALT